MHLENDHFVYVSGDHGSGWINKDVLYLVPDHVRELTALLAQLKTGVEADVVCGPATGGLVISQWLAWHLNLFSVGTAGGVSEEFSWHGWLIFGLHDFDPKARSDRSI